MSTRLLRVKVEADGATKHLYDERVKISVGDKKIERASTVDPWFGDHWHVTLFPEGKIWQELPQPFKTRSKALAAEREWLEEVWMTMKNP